MQPTQMLLAALLAASSAAAAPTATKSMMANGPEWTIESMKRVCAKDDSSCTWTFAIDNHDSDPTPCKYVVTHDKASQSNGGPVSCGRYTVTSGWSGHFGEGKGFTVLSVIDYNNKKIIWPGYTDLQVQDGNVVEPDQSYAPQTLP